jgi:tricarballylate dehydrogenase
MATVPADTIRADVAVVGAGNAALCAALAAAEAGARVVVLEAAPEDERGGNSAYTAGAMRTTFDGIADIKKLVPDLGAAEEASTDFGSYSFDEYFDDMTRITQFRCDADLVEILIRRSLPTLEWMRGHGVRFQPSYGRQAFKHEGRFKFWGGLAVETWGGGPGLVQALFDGAARAGVQVVYGARARELVLDGGAVRGVRATLRGGGTLDVAAGAVVLAAGGFEANAEMRTRYLGPGWDLAKVRGSRHNMGDGIRMGLEAGAQPFGNWSGCHAVGWDMNAPLTGDLAVGDGFQKHSYPFGIMVNRRGERFLDEGADFRNYTYAKYGREILAQPGQVAWQIFDAKVSHLLRDEYRIRQVTRVQADSIAELAAGMEGVDAARLAETVAEFNRAVKTDMPFDPNVKDGRGTEGLTVAKSNWANPLDTPPFEAYGVTCGITFTFGGLRIDGTGRVLDAGDAPIPGLHAAGELVGGLFYFNYPGGTGLTSGAVFGRLAGTSAAAAAA